MALTFKLQPPPELLAVPEPVLASLARRFLVDPFSSDAGPDLSGLSPEALRALALVADALKVSLESVQSSGGQLRSQVVDLLVEVLKRSSLDESRGKAAKEGLGAAGLLPSAQYSIKFNDLMKQFEQLGERRTHVEEVMRAPHSVQHISPPSEDSHSEGHSIFARAIRPPKGKEFLQLVVAGRKGSELNFAGAWRLYPELVAWEDSTSLLQVLERFVDRYGLAFSFARSEPLRFVKHRIFQLPVDFRPNAGPEIHILPEPEKKNDDFIANLAARIRPDRTAELGLGYVIDTTQYRSEVNHIARR